MENKEIIKTEEIINHDVQMADNVQEMKCPACGAPISLDEGIEAVICEYCGTKVFVDDEIYKYHRILKAKSEAKQREAKAQFELEKEKEIFNDRRKVVNILSERPIECIAVILCTIWLITNMIHGHFGLAHILIEFVVIIWAMGTERRPLAFTNLGIYFKNNKGHAFVFVLSVIFLLACLTEGFSMILFLLSLGGMVWSIKTGTKTGIIVDTEKDIRFVYVRNNAINYSGKPYMEVMEELQACGFSDIVAIKKKDLVKGWFAKAGSVISVSINGDKSFSEGNEYPSDAKVIVEYHEFKE